MSDGPNFCRTRAHNIPFEMQRSPGGDSDTYYKEFWSPQLVNSSFVAKVTWDDSSDFISDMIGIHLKVGTGITRQNPQPHPYINNLWCVGLELVRNLGELTYDPINGNAVEYEEVEYNCTFARFLYDVRDDSEISPGSGGELRRYVERRTKLAGKSLQTHGQFEFVSARAPAWNAHTEYNLNFESYYAGKNWKSLTNGNINNTPAEDANWTTVGATGGDAAVHDLIPTPPAIMTPWREIEYIWHYVPGPIHRLRKTADTLYGTINDDVFDVDPLDTVNSGYEAGTLLYVGMEEERVPSTPQGNELWKITHKMLYNKNLWNTAYRPHSSGINHRGDWDLVRMRNITPNKPPFASTAFPLLFLL